MSTSDCAPAADSAPFVWRGERVAKEFRGGTRRVCHPDQTLARMRRFMGPMSITRLANVTGLDCIGVPVVLAYRPNSRSLVTAAGKGVDLAAAKASALMESIELFHAERVTNGLLFGSRNDLRYVYPLVPIEGLPRIAFSRYTDNTPILWIRGTSLRTEASVWLPFELVHTNYLLPLPSGSGCFVLTSNGLASGNHPLEAILHGLCEVIERDATTLFGQRSAHERERRRIDIATVDDGPCRAVLDAYDRAGVLAGVWETTSDIGVPAFQCVSVDREANGFRRMPAALGFGCHLAPEVALLRALTEAAQSRLTMVAGSRDDTGRWRVARATDADAVQAVREQLRGAGTRDFAAVTSCEAETLDDDLVRLLDRLHTVGVDSPIVVDLTRPEFRIPVVRVVVPGLEPHHAIPGYLPGRRAERVALEAAGETPA